MDFDIIDDTRPRLQLQSGGNGADEEQTKSFGKVHAGICASVGILLIGLGLGLVAGPLQFVAIWVGFSLILGPFAPSLVTGGDCRVGVGEPVLPEVVAEDSVEQIGSGGGGGRSHYYNSREKHAPRKAVEGVNGAAGGLGLAPAGIAHNDGKSGTKVYNDGKLATKVSLQREGGSSGAVEGEKEWNSEEVDLLKKLIVKHPRGTLRRWEVIAEALGGKYSVDSVVKMSKALGQKKVGGGDQDAYSRFLSQRKGSDIAIASPLSQRDSGDQQQNDDDKTVLTTESDEGAASGGKGRWTEVEDKALLTALKTFPKDSPMRWDKVALALPGRTKAQCFRRFSDLRKSFRTAIGS